MNNNTNRYVVIMAGGKGERFWPQSRLKRPKQLLPIVGDKPLLTQTVDRLKGFVPLENIIIVTNAEQAESVKEVCPELPVENIVGEPIGRDTAAAVGLSTVIVKQKNPDATFAMLPADHVIHNHEAYQSVLEGAFQAAETNEALVTIGIEASYAATGYGYIKHLGEVAQPNGHSLYDVERFVEKPDLDTAKTYIEQGTYFWNAGMFVWQVPVISGEFEKNTPGLWNALSKIETGLNNGEELTVLLEKHYPSLEKISVDYAIMEKAAKVMVIKSAFDWDDVGEWPAVARHFPEDENGNVVKGQAIIESGKNNIVINEGGHLTAILGLEDIIVVQTEDATLICPKSKAQEIKNTVKKIAGNVNWQHLV